MVKKEDENREVINVPKWPKRNTLEQVRSMVKNFVHEKMGINFSDPFKFPNLAKSWDGLIKKLKDYVYLFSNIRCCITFYKCIPVLKYKMM